MRSFGQMLVGAVALMGCQGTLQGDTNGDTAGDTAGDTSVDTAWTPTCSSGEHWTFGNAGSANMRPGHDCVTCHATSEGPNFGMAGTVMGAVHDEDDCDGVSGVIVHITDVHGTTTNFTTNRAGNFYNRGSFDMPITASVEYQGRIVEMASEVNSADCASCHTVAGDSGAPGRIVAP